MQGDSSDLHYETQSKYLQDHLGLWRDGMWESTKQVSICFTQNCDVQKFSEGIQKIIPYLKPQDGIIVITTHNKEEHSLYQIWMDKQKLKAKVVELYSHRSKVKEDWDDILTILEKFRKYYQSPL